MELIADYKEIAEKLVSDWDILPIYERLADTFEQTVFYHEYAGMLEKIYNITKNSELLLKIGDIFTRHLKYPDVALSVYDLYFKKTNPLLYDRYMSVLVDKGYDEFSEKLMPEPEVCSELQDIVDRYISVVYLMVYFVKRKNYDAVLELADYIDRLHAKIDDYVNTHPDVNRSALQDANDSNCHISKLLSKVVHNIDINMLAIKFDVKNERPYINILDDYVFCENYSKALEFFNEKYTKAFGVVKFKTPAEVCWFLSEKFAKIDNYYHSVNCQKIAINLELSMQGEICG